MKLTVLSIHIVVFLSIEALLFSASCPSAGDTKRLQSSSAALERRGFWQEIGHGASDFFGHIGDAFIDGAESVTDAWRRLFGDVADATIDLVVPHALQDLPLPQRIQDRLGNDEERTGHLPLRVINLPNYGNWTDNGWNLRIRAVAYKQPDASQRDLDDRMARFLLKHGDVTNTTSFSAEELAHIRNATASLFISQRYNQELAFDVARVNVVNGAEELGRWQVAQHPQRSSMMGDVDAFVPLDQADFDRGHSSSKLQRLKVLARDAELGETESWLVPPKGITVLSDLDDVIKETVIWHPLKGALVNTFVHPDTPWMNMPEVLTSWSHSFPALHFHYLSLTPEQVSRTTLQFLQELYPAGSLDMRPMTKEGIGLGARTMYMRKIFESFPLRKFVLLGDTSTAELLKSYTTVLKEKPDQLQCMFIRNDSATDGPQWKPFDTTLFKGIAEDKFMFFRVPDDLLGLNITDGECINTTFSQNLTYSVQNVPMMSDGVSEDIFEALPFLKWLVNMS